MTSEESPLLTRAEAARWCRVSVAAFDAHIRPHLPVKRVGRRVLVHRADLEAWAQSEDAKRAAPERARPINARPQRGALVQQLLASPQAKEMRERITRKIERARERANAANN